MIRGWRNDPRWVEYYAKRAAEKAEKAAKRAMFESRIDSDLAFQFYEQHKNRLQPGTS